MKLHEIKGFEDYKAWLAELNSVCRIEGDEIVFGTGHYAVSLAACDTHSRILAWAFHLAHKSWVTASILERFILLATEHHHLPMPDV